MPEQLSKSKNLIMNSCEENTTTFLPLIKNVLVFSPSTETYLEPLNSIVAAQAFKNHLHSYDYAKSWFNEWLA